MVLSVLEQLNRRVKDMAASYTGSRSKTLTPKTNNSSRSSSSSVIIEPVKTSSSRTKTYPGPDVPGSSGTSRTSSSRSSKLPSGVFQNRTTGAYTDKFGNEVELYTDDRGSQRLKPLSPSGASATKPIVPLGSNDFQTNDVLEKLAFKVDMGYIPTEEERMQLLNYAADKRFAATRDQDAYDPVSASQKVYDAATKAIQEQITRQQGLRDDKADFLADDRQRKIDEYKRNLDTAYQSQIDEAIETGENRKDDTNLGLSFQGFNRSSLAVEKIDEINKDVEKAKNAIEAVKQVELMRYQAELRGADENTLRAFDNRINALNGEIQRLQIESATKAEELRQQAAAVGDNATLELLESLNLQAQEEIKPEADVDLSKEMGFLITSSGEAIVDAEGNPIKFPPGADKQQILNMGKELGAFVYNFDTGETRSIVPGFGAGYSGGGGGRGGGGTSGTPETQYYQLIQQMDALNLWELTNLDREKAISSVSTAQGGIGARALTFYGPMMQEAIGAFSSKLDLASQAEQDVVKAFEQGNYNKDAIAQDLANRYEISSEDAKNIIQSAPVVDPRTILQRANDNTKPIDWGNIGNRFREFIDRGRVNK